jgi:gamma-glutamylcyclotransferase (GGCT)/AIG2-like uncharacterized protein YtfP
MRFFFYGTLIDATANAMARRVHEWMTVLGPATTGGELFAVPDPDGWYPLLLPGGGTVQGVVCEAGDSFGPAELAMLDAYESFDPADEPASLYVRREVLTSMGPAQAYLASQPLPASTLPIRNGDFREWLAQTGYSPFAPPGPCC